MREYDFDKFTERVGTGSAKYDSATDFDMPEDLIPFWVADMDFPTAPAVLEALHQKIDHGIFGYSYIGESYYEALKNWYKTKFDFDIKNEWLITTPGVVFAISMAIRSLTEMGDGILIQQPVYYSIRKVIERNGRKTVINSLVNKNGKYFINIEDFEKKIIENKVKMFVLCSPHNPVGRVWTKQELQAMADICKKHNVIVVADEIHSDFVWGENKHTVFQTIKGMEDITITCTSPSKTFNLAGLQLSNIIIKNEEYRKKIKSAIDDTGYDEPSGLGLVACEAAYSNGEKWLEDLKVYIQSNIDKTKEFIDKNLPKVKFTKPEGAYVIWLDFSDYGFEDKEINRIIVEDAKLWLDGGKMFGVEGEFFQRINVACPWGQLEKGLNNLKKAFEPYK